MCASTIPTSNPRVGSICTGNVGHGRTSVFTSSSSSSSSSSSRVASGANTPVADFPSRLVPFPCLPSPTATRIVLPDSTTLCDSPRSRQLSLTTLVGSSIFSRSTKLSCDPSMQKSPAAACIDVASSPVAAFSPSNSAVNHLRVLMCRGTRASTDSSSSIEDMELPPKAIQPHTVSLLALAGIRHNRSPYDVDDDSDDGDEAFWPKRSAPSRHISSISVATPVPSHDPAQPAEISAKTDPSPLTRPCGRTGTRKIRSNSRSTLPSASRSDYSSELPASRKGQSPQRCRKARASSIDNFTDDPSLFLRAKKCSQAAPSKGVREDCTLNPALAAIERASRLRSRCVCVVCGKIGSDFPRCPRCTVTWCSRDCRMSSAAAGSARHKCSNDNAACKPSTANGMAQSVCLYV